MELATGYYVNAFSDEVDVFVIFNEASSDLTSDEVSLVETVVKKAIQETTTAEELRTALQHYFDHCDMEFAEWGVQIVINKHYKDFPPLAVHSTEQAKKTARDVVEIFEDFLEERNINIPNPDKAQSEDPCLIYGTDYGELVDRVAAVLATEPATATASAAKTSPVTVAYAAVIPLAVRLLEEFATCSFFKQPTPWLPIATEKESGKVCFVRMMMGTKGEFEIHVMNEFIDLSYYRASEHRTIVGVSNTLRLIQDDIRNGLIAPF